MSYILQNLHFIFIHFPIALLLVSFLFDLLGSLLRKSDWHTAGLLCLILGTLGAIAAVATGPEDRNPLLPTHELFGKLTMILFILLTLARLFYRFRKSADIGGAPVYLAAALIGICLVSYTGHLGGQMVHKQRPAVPGKPGSGPVRPPGGSPSGNPAPNAPAVKSST
ncbi:DUF2231 domain-containing protein [Paenibacillus filicis]|uniref:DUF2231 domain-containing protein n=1 Tax=Paenibacillus gyeongsangnamensis TaxID=3388067 RepID=A0ABT4QB91_9BACL|nr:DUF2231 domain-containing protein [Paenibacillus filicis]MCZ8514041.1 DUF2231 domain-containing protein [Paenibacillus filicis]